MKREREHFQPCVGPTVRGGVWIEECIRRPSAEENRELAEKIAREVRRANEQFERERLEREHSEKK